MLKRMSATIDDQESISLPYPGGYAGAGENRGKECCQKNSEIGSKGVQYVFQRISARRHQPMLRWVVFFRFARNGMRLSLSGRSRCSKLS